MSEHSQIEIEEQAGAVTAVLAQLPDLVSQLEYACPWLVEVRERPGAHREAVGSLIVGHARGAEALWAAITE